MWEIPVLGLMTAAWTDLFSSRSTMISHAVCFQFMASCVRHWGWCSKLSDHICLEDEPADCDGSLTDSVHKQNHFKVFH